MKTGTLKVAPAQTVREGGATTLPPWAEALRAGQLSAALRSLLQEPSADPEVVDALGELEEVRAFLRAKAWDRAHRRVAALKLPEAVRAAMPSDPATLQAQVAQLGVSGKHLERGEPEAALALLAGITEPLLHAEAETQRGTAHIFLGDPQAAKDAFTRALTSDAKHYRAQTNLGNVALEEGRVDEAIALYEGALKLNDSFANAHHNLGVAYRRKGQIDRSVKAIRRAQRVGRQRDREEARSALQGFGGRGARQGVRWLLYALLALGILFLLQTQGVL
ncbi:tetratricopeptide repeat protein [Truepera radiovictrix]|uniref:TPR repeat-containing protein n=1 Tax=Truepera radiovictrix (strain DSM 17093 / CIP 108686 / LMG 22925 / RQ-24) TaxID=649638 RepID=D7CWX2_TRURR|nr:tetratricopeptide repeat protein [Truepera radiovictrix]ADI14480.1 TPR repeat-containing protein [Truepera radiovictrix DSM 17093]WMT56965.1 tetratricopeptide repeat protein [Truepera radiovictrix]